MKLILFLFAVLLFGLGETTCAVAEPLDPSSGNLAFAGFLDTYYVHDFNDPFTSTRPYTTQALYDDEARINLGVIEARLSEEQIRARLAIQAGDSVKSNYAAEEDLFFRYIQESSLGIEITDNLWIDGGIFLSHIGFESFNSKDDWNYTRSIVAEYSPYYETGGKITYQATDTLGVQFLLLHGWQNISTASEPGFGLQLNYAPDSATQFTYANYLGHQNGGFRNFHDFIARRDLTEDFSVALQVDFGQQSREEEDAAGWYGFSLMSRYKITPKVAIGSRVERYYDPHQVLLTTVSGENYNATGLSANIDYEFYKGLVWRTEYRVMFGENAVFPEDNVGDFSKDDSIIVTSLSYAFDVGGFKW